MGSFLSYDMKDTCALRCMLLSWARHFSSDQKCQQKLVNRVINCACFDESIFTSDNLDRELFRIMHQQMLDDIDAADHVPLPQSMVKQEK